MTQCIPERTEARKTEIIQACATLYETHSFHEITLKDISAFTSISRPSIYNYFQTKEEIFMALFQQEFELWSQNLDQMSSSGTSLTPESLADGLARSLEKRPRLLKLLAMNLFDMVSNSRLENLVQFKASYRDARRAVHDLLLNLRPEMQEQEIQHFIFCFFPFIFGIHPYTYHTPKQLEAMKLAGLTHPQSTIYELTRTFILTLIHA